MKLRLLLFLFSVCFSTVLFAQPAYDECQTFFNLGAVPFCDSSTFYTNIDATASSVLPDAIPENFNGGLVDRDVWFKFTASTDEEFLDYTITVSGLSDGVSPAMKNPQVALYRGDCPDEMYFLDGASAELNESSISFNILGLTPGFSYFLRVNDYTATALPNAGTFVLCVDSIKVASGIGDGGTTDDFGSICDDGGPDSNYTDNQNYTYQICPGTPHECLVFEVEYFNLEGGFGDGDELLIYDGDSSSTNLAGTIGGFTSGGTNNWGGSSQTYYLESGCVTLDWNSNANINLEGFCSNWGISNDACPVEPVMELGIGATDAQIIENLSSPQTEITVFDINCDSISIGTFQNSPDHPLGLDKGLVLSSGNAGQINNPDSGFFASSPTGSGSDADLDALSVLSGSNLVSNDACIVELDVYAYGDQLAFEYVFGSEEYPNFVNGNVSDIFALLISGPGITGEPTVNDQENLAVIPNTNTFIEINTVNGAENWQYYRANNNSTEGICFGGLTTDSLSLIKKSLTAKRQVIPCNSYRLKFAIADRGDSVYDSGVFISEISAGVPTITLQFSEGIDYLVEDCVNEIESLTIELSEPTEDTLSFLLELSGTATQGLDYITNLPPTVLFYPGDQSFTFTLEVINDNIAEVGDTLTISLKNDFGCGQITYVTLDVPILDAPSVEISSGEDTVFVCAGFSVGLSVGGANQFGYVWSPGALLDNPFISNPQATVLNDTTFYVTGTVGTCAATDSVFVKVISPEVSAITTDNGLCNGEVTTLTAINNVSDQGVEWFPANVASPTSPNTEATPAVTTTYTAKVSIAGCSVTDTVTIFVDQFILPELTTLDTGICQSYSVILASPTAVADMVYQWYPSTYLNDDNVSNAVSTPDEDIVYILVANSANDYCRDTLDEISIEVTPAVLDAQGEEYFERCIGVDVAVTVVTNTGGIGLSWSPTFTSGDKLNPIFTPTESTLFIATLQIGTCTLFDSVRIRIDSLPLTQLALQPAKPVYCPGEPVVILSSIYEPTDFPDIENTWSPDAGTETPIDEWNLVLTTDTTITYKRLITNRTCAAEDSITIIVIDPEITVLPADTIVCPNEPVLIVAASANEVSNIVWTPSEFLSCPDCLTPIATTPTTATFSMTGDVQGCPVAGSATVQISETVSVSIAATPEGEILQGESVTLNAITVPDVSATGSFTWTENGTLIGSGPQITQVIDQIATTYKVELASGTNCISRDSITIAGTPPNFQLPNSFSPNGDGVNEIFNIVAGTGSNYVLQNFQVFNRWGTVVFDKIDGTGWFGDFKGELQPSDLYNYVIKIALPDGTSKTFTGEILLLR